MLKRVNWNDMISFMNAYIEAFSKIHNDYWNALLQNVECSLVQFNTLHHFLVTEFGQSYSSDLHECLVYEREFGGFLLSTFSLKQRSIMRSVETVSPSMESEVSLTRESVCGKPRATCIKEPLVRPLNNSYWHMLHSHRLPSHTGTIKEC